jgi:hypothetical protein
MSSGINVTYTSTLYDKSNGNNDISASTSEAERSNKKRKLVMPEVAFSSNLVEDLKVKVEEKPIGKF